jgi:hypothetical protein
MISAYLAIFSVNATLLIILHATAGSDRKLTKAHKRNRVDLAKALQRQTRRCPDCNKFDCCCLPINRKVGQR